MSEIVAEAQKIEVESPPEYIAKPNWFKGYIEGNALIPQIFNIFGFTTMAAVLGDPPEKWEEFGLSVLSDDQIKDLGRYMTHLHQGKGINVVDQHHQKPEVESKVVPEYRMQHLWRIAKNWVYMSLVDYIREVKKEPPENFDFSKPEYYQKYSKELDSFFDDPENAKKVEELKAVTAATREGYLTNRGKQLARIYRATFDRRETPSGGIEVDDDLYDAIEELQQQDPNTDIQKLARREFSQQARELALSKVPEFRNSSWYANLAF